MKHNPTVKYVELVVGDDTYKLTFSFNQLAIAEKLTGLNLLQAINLSNASVSGLRGLLYACALKAQPKLTIEQCGDLLEKAGIDKTVEVILEAWAANRPPSDPTEPGMDATVSNG